MGSPSVLLQTFLKRVTWPVYGQAPQPLLFRLGILCHRQILKTKINASLKTMKTINNAPSSFITKYCYVLSYQIPFKYQARRNLLGCTGVVYCSLCKCCLLICGVNTSYLFLTDPSLPVAPFSGLKQFKNMHSLYVSNTWVFFREFANQKDWHQPNLIFSSVRFCCWSFVLTYCIQFNVWSGKNIDCVTKILHECITKIFQSKS